MNIGAGNTWAATSPLYAWASPNGNFIAGVYQIDIKMANWSKSGGSDAPENERYTGILFGANTQGERPDASTTGMGFILTGNYKAASAGGNPTWSVYDRGTKVAQGYQTAPGAQFWDTIKILVDNTGVNTVASIWYNNALVVQNHVASQKFQNNYVTMAPDR